jgi:hypothetical protein
MYMTSGGAPFGEFVRVEDEGASDVNWHVEPASAAMMTVTPVPDGAVYVAV